MEGRRLLGAALLVVGLGLVLVGGAGMLAPPSGEPTATAPVPPASQDAGTAGQPTASTPPATTASAPALTPGPPTTGPSEDVGALIRAFISRLENAVRNGTQETVAANLGGAVIDRYGVSSCEEYLASRDPSPEQRFEILSISGPGPWDYTTDGLTTTIPDAWTLEARVTGPNASGEVATRDADLHVRVGDGTVFWYTDCGDPLPP